MADLKISQLTAITAIDLASTDVLPVVDTSATTTKKVAMNDVAEYVSASSAVTNLVSPKVDKALTLNAQTGVSYTLVSDDNAKVVTLSNASAVTVTIPTNSAQPFTVGSQINLVQIGAGQVTVSPNGGVTLRSQGAKYKLNGQYAAATLLKIGTDEWVLIGNTAA